MTLAEIEEGKVATISRIKPKARGRKKLADIGLIPGTEVEVEGRSPFGDLLRIKLMETSISIDIKDAANIEVKE